MAKTKPVKKFRLGCIPSVPSINDIPFKVAAPVALPSKADLLPNMPAILNQGNLGSCTAHGTSRAFKHLLIKEGLPIFDPSRLMLYYDTRLLEGTVNSDSGATIRNAIKAATEGVCSETVWPYVVGQFATKPPQKCYDEAETAGHKALVTRRVLNSHQDIKTAIFMGNAVVIGFAVYESFFSIGKDGYMSYPVPGEQIQGGHCVTIEGYDDADQHYTCANSWGSDWADAGRFLMPYNVAIDQRLVFELYTIERI